MDKLRSLNIHEISEKFDHLRGAVKVLSAIDTEYAAGNHINQSLLTLLAAIPAAMKAIADCEHSIVKGPVEEEFLDKEAFVNFLDKFSKAGEEMKAACSSLQTPTNFDAAALQVVKTKFGAWTVRVAALVGYQGRL